MKNACLESLIKQSLIKSFFSECNCAPVEYDALYGVLLNTESVSKLCPFNFIRSVDSIKNDSSGILREWLLGFREETSPDAAGKRVSRAIGRLAKDYGSVLPDVMRGENSLAIMFRLFFLPGDTLFSLPFKTTSALQLTKSVLLSTILLDILFTREEFRGKSTEYWLERLLCSSVGLMSTLQELST